MSSQHIVFAHQSDAMPYELEGVDTSARDWDGALPSTTHTIRLRRISEVMGREVHAYVEVRVTGRKVREHSIPGYGRARGIAVRVRFTGAEDAQAWCAGVVLI